MAAFGELFGPGKLRKESSEDDGTGERFEAGPLDLTSGVVRLAPRPRPNTDDTPADD